MQSWLSFDPKFAERFSDMFAAMTGLGGTRPTVTDALAVVDAAGRFAQANDVIGLTPLPGARNEIVKLLLRHAKT